MCFKNSPPYPPKGDKKYTKKLRKSPSGGFRGLYGANWISEIYYKQYLRLYITCTMSL